MSSTRRPSTDDTLRCPQCQANVSFVASWTCRGLWGYKEVRTYECADHGPIFVSPETTIGHEPSVASAKSLDEGDRDSLVSAPRKPTPIINADAIAIPEPKSESN